MIFFSLYIWVRAVLIQKINANVKADILITDGVYGIVRNPVYTAFIFIFTVILLFAKNYFLLILPIIFWVFLTILMKASEEKWLKAKFGKEYDLYCKRVNRVIPWFPKKYTFKNWHRISRRSLIIKDRLQISYQLFF